jgi:hypothetical protein
MIAKLATAAAAATGLLLAGSASATVITFDNLGVTTQYASPNHIYDVGSGYQIDASQAVGQTDDRIINADATSNMMESGGNTTDSFLWSQNPDDTKVLVLSRTDNGLFDFNSLDFHGWNNNFATLLTVTGTKADNSTVVTAFTVTNTFEDPYQFGVLPGTFDDLKSVTFTINYGESGGVSQFDNLDVTSTGVPEPESWALMLLGFGGLGAVLRARRQASMA